MNNEECFDVWAPELNPWSRWAKPALFCGPTVPAPGQPAATGQPSAQVMVPGAATAVPAAPAAPDIDVSWVQDPRPRTALVVDLPGVASVRAGLALARRGYRLVPLFNTTVGPSPVIDTASIAAELMKGAEELRTISLPPDAPPAFLLDSERTRPSTPPAPGRYDNRWIVFPQDFPSANYLQAAGIGEILLVQREAAAPADDLAHVLLRWQQAGLQLLAGDPQTRGRPRTLAVTPPSRFRRAWYRALALAGFRRNDAGGFGAIIPLVTSSGGYG